MCTYINVGRDFEHLDPKEDWLPFRNARDVNATTSGFDGYQESEPDSDRHYKTDTTLSWSTNSNINNTPGRLERKEAVSAAGTISFPCETLFFV